MKARERAAHLFLFWPAVFLIRFGTLLLSLSATVVGRVTLRPLLRLFCRFVLYARSLPLLRGETQHVLSTAELSSLIAAQKLVAVIPCACRGGRTTCGRPAHRPHEPYTCLSFGLAAQLQIGSGLGRRMTPQDALALCERAADSGLAHHAIYSLGMLAELCNCCPETCAAIKAFSSGLPEAVRPSPVVALRGPDCDGCAGRSGRLCEDLCPYGTVPSSSDCLGCGLCARHCPNRAIRMVDRGVCMAAYSHHMTLESNGAAEAEQRQGADALGHFLSGRDFDKKK